MPNSAETRIALQEQESKSIREALAEHEKRQNEFMLRTDKRTENIESSFKDLVEKMDRLIAQSNEWSGVRKTLGAIVTILTLAGAAVGWLLAHFWPAAK